MKRNLTKILILFSIISFLSCRNIIHSVNNIQLLPRESDVPGWRLNSAPKEYTVDNVHRYLHNKGRIFKKYGFRSVSVAKYHSINDQSRLTTVEIYKMDSTLNAFGIMGIERGFNHIEDSVFENSYTKGAGFYFRKGIYYIRIEASKTTDSFTIQRDNIIFAQVVHENIKNPNEPLQDYVALFGDNKRVSDVVYYIDGHPQLPEIDNLFVRGKRISGRIKHIIYSKRDSCYESLKYISSLVQEMEPPFVLSNAEEFQIAFNRSENNNYIFIAVYKEWIFGIINADTKFEGKKIVHRLYTELIEFLKSSNKYSLLIP
ncbi:MAG: DUF6599 family protein [Spirochaetota bacterium]|nr:DUF6599 family protein [Spirochaetota bacterium]